MALADVYDRPHQQALLQGCHVPPGGGADHTGGTRQSFDPDITDAFARIHQQFHEIALRYNDDKGERESNRDQAVAGSRSVKTKPSRSTVSPTRMARDAGTWGRPRPGVELPVLAAGIHPGGRAASKAGPNSRPPNPASSLPGSRGRPWP